MKNFNLFLILLILPAGVVFAQTIQQQILQNAAVSLNAQYNLDEQEIATWQTDINQTNADAQAISSELNALSNIDNSVSVNQANMQINVGSDAIASNLNA